MDKYDPMKNPDGASWRAPGEHKRIDNNPRRRVFLTGGTGYVGSRLLARLVARGHEVRALTREQSVHRLGLGSIPVVGDALAKGNYPGQLAGSEVLVHLIGVSHPNPSKTDEFRRIDLASVEVAVDAAVRAGVRHFVYVSVAHPAPVMRAYWQVRAECERLIAGSGLHGTILRPWYVLGPGHRWPYLLMPLYWILGHMPATHEAARRLGMVTIDQMLAALCAAVENPADGLRILDASEIRRSFRDSPRLTRGAQDDP